MFSNENGVRVPTAGVGNGPGLSPGYCFMWTFRVCIVSSQATQPQFCSPLDYGPMASQCGHWRQCPCKSASTCNNNNAAIGQHWWSQRDPLLTAVGRCVTDVNIIRNRLCEFVQSQGELNWCWAPNQRIQRFHRQATKLRLVQWVKRGKPYFFCL